MNKYNKEDLVVALDIGTTKICAIAGYKNSHDRIEIVAISKVPSVGVRRGVVSNIDKTVRAIEDAVAIVSDAINETVEEIYIGIAGQHIKSFHFQGMKVRHNANDEISQEDIDKLKADMHKISLTPGDRILHVIPQEYKVDSEHGIVDPIGMSGSRLDANFHIITAQASAFNNITRCVKKSQLQAKELTLEPLASASAVLTQEELEAGVALVDIGGGTTDMAIFHEGIIRHTAVIPFGGNIITSDIKSGCTVMSKQAEKLKKKFGSALSEEVKNNRIITIPGLKGHADKEITERNLARIIQARVEEIFDFVYWEIQNSDYSDKLIGGIVLTGGGAMMKNIKDLCELNTGFQTRVGEPTEYLAQGYDKRLTNSLYATAIGLLINGIEIEEQEKRNIQAERVNEIQEPETFNEEPFDTADNSNESDEVYNENTNTKSKGFVNQVQRIVKFFESAPDNSDY